MSDKERFEQWCVVEIMGHQQFAGYVTEQTLGGASFVRVDVPAIGGMPAFSKLFGAASIYCITPCSEDVARKAAERFVSRPLNCLALPAPEPVAAASTSTGPNDAWDNEEDDEDIVLGEEYDDMY